jgi:hypothetical protein
MIQGIPNIDCVSVHQPLFLMLKMKGLNRIFPLPIPDLPVLLRQQRGS